MTTDDERERLIKDARVTELAKLFVHLVGHKTCSGYVVSLTDGRTLSITCLVCGQTSFNPNDVTQKYCGACHIFHEEGKANP